MKRNFFTLALAMLLSITSFAQDNSKGIEYYEANLYDFAKTFFENQKNSDTDIQSEKYYYLGLISIAENTDSASYFFERAVGVNPKAPWGYIGRGRMALVQSDEDIIKDSFKKALKYGKKNAAALVNMAEAYYANNDKQKAQEYIDMAKKRDMKYSGIYLAEGDFFMEENQVGEAINKYKQAQIFNTGDKLATLKLARLYMKMNRKDLAIDHLNSIFATDPNNIPATIVYGEIKNSENKFKEAIAAFDKVLQAGNAPINVSERYAQALYFDKQYAKSLQQTQLCLEQNPNNIVIKRINAYNLYELKEYQQASEQISNLINSTNEKNIIYQDYMTFARSLFAVTPKTLKDAKSKDDTLSYVAARRQIIDAFEKAIEIKPDLADTYKEYAYSNYKFFDYEKAIPLYEKYFELNPNALTIDIYTYSDACLNMAKIYLSKFTNIKDSNDSNDEDINENKDLFMSYVDKGARANERIIERAPENYLGYYSLAKNNSLLDDYERILTGKVSGVAKENYEKAIEIMLAQNENNSLNSRIISSYEYLSAYYINNGDVKSTIDMNQRILLLDSANERANYILEQLNAPKVAAEKKK